MTDLPELIANVYRACGWADIHPRWVGGDIYDDPISGVPTYFGPIGLDAFVRDIVPVLKERGWDWHVGQHKDRYSCVLDKSFPHYWGEGSTPVEACFRAAWEALIPSESHDAPSPHP